jgi:hypothetical protein
MQLTPFWEAVSRSASQMFPNVLRNSKVRYRVHTIPPAVPILSRSIQSVSLSYLFKIRLPIFVQNFQVVLVFNTLSPISYMHSSPPISMPATCSAHLKFEVFTAATMKNGVFWDVTQCGSCKNQRNRLLVTASVLILQRFLSPWCRSD